jgi:hypothetical protein
LQFQAQTAYPVPPQRPRLPRGLSYVETSRSYAGKLRRSVRRPFGSSKCLSDIGEGNIMKTRQTALKTIDEYIAGFPKDVQEILEKIRMTVRKAAPDAQETISYQIPTFTLKGKYLVYFAAYKKRYPCT